ncbi:Hypothetical predicted protein [Marmota monax]|uniref:MOB kinase activator 3A n=1 Tax=Marmota monax TaxID=9995 RepID=A0A5E4BGX3_MARMO|nr:Hypothetical predicted protein [Marmota monax]
MSSPFLKQVFNKDKTFRPKRKFEPGTQRFELHKRAQASLNAGLDLRLAVQLPPGEELNDWVAVHVVDFFNRINLIYGTISDGCTEQSCPVMSGGPKYEYRWQDEQRFRRPTALSAPRYMDQLMDWVEVQINNEDVFPTNVGTPFPKSFLQVARKILSRLFRVFVHVYIHHFDRIAQMGSEAHVNTCYKHFYYFVTEFGLIDTKELEPLVRGRGAVGAVQRGLGSASEGSGQPVPTALAKRLRSHQPMPPPQEPEGGVRVRPVPARPRPILRLVEAEEGCVLPRLDQPG